MGMLKESQRASRCARERGGPPPLASSLAARSSKIITSLVNDIIMPPIGKLTGGVDFKELFINLDPSKLTKAGAAVKTVADAKDAGATVITCGAFFTTILDFLLVSLCIFLVVKGINALKRKEEAVVPEPTAQEKLLTEIRDLLRNK